MSDEPTAPAATEVEPPAAAPTGGRSGPNYAARRMLVTTVAIVAVAAFGVVVWMVVRGDDDAFRSDGRSWSEIVVVDRSDGTVTVLDADGAVDRTIVGRGRVSDVYTIGDRIALVGPTQIVIEGGDVAVTVPIERSDVVRPIRTVDGLDLAVGSPTGGNVSLVDVVTGEVIDVGGRAREAAPESFGEPRMFVETVQWSADGRRFAIADTASFQTVVVGKDEPAATFFRAQPVAIDDDRVATSQTLGSQAEVEVYDADGESRARVPVAIPAGGVLGDDLTLVSIRGDITRVREGATEAERVAGVAVPSGDTVAAVRRIGDRIVVTGGAFEALVDLAGETLFTTTFTTPVAALDVDPRWTCVPIGGEGAFHSIITVEDGEQLADLSDLAVTDVAGDGCTVLGDRAGVAEVVGSEGSVSLGAVRSARLAPDGRSVVRTTTSGRTELVEVDGATLGDAIDLGDDVPNGALIAFLD